MILPRVATVSRDGERRMKGISDSLYAYIDRYDLWFNREEQSLWLDDLVLNVEKP